MGWIAIVDNADTRLCESSDLGVTNTYEQAKREAVAHLEGFLEPYLARLEELRSDVFRERGKRPHLKAWRSGPILVVAKTKKRARELLGCSRSELDNDYSEANGDWYYIYAREEGIWENESTSKGVGDSKYVKRLSRPDAIALLQAKIASYANLSVQQLASRIGQETHEGTTPAGAPYRITIDCHVSECFAHEKRIVVDGRFDQGLRRGEYVYDGFHKVIEPAPAIDWNWCEDGF